VWGAPLSGQRRWMLRSAELTKPDTDVSLLFNGPDTSLASLLKQLEAEMARPLESELQRHIYIELPAALLHQDFELDEWLHSHPDWHSSFAGLVSEEAHYLNGHYRGLYEEFSRSSQSAVILARSQDARNELPLWVERALLDFGKRVEVFEDDLWPRALVRGSVEAPQHLGLKSLTEFKDEYDDVEMPIGPMDRPKIELLFRQMIQGDFGTLWGAEVIRAVGPDSEGRTEVQGLSLAPHAIYEWRTKVRARCVGLGAQVSLFNVVGVALEKNNLTKSLRALQLLADS